MLLLLVIVASLSSMKKKTGETIPIGTRMWYQSTTVPWLCDCWQYKGIAQGGWQMVPNSVCNIR